MGGNWVLKKKKSGVGVVTVLPDLAVVFTGNSALGNPGTYPAP